MEPIIEKHAHNIIFGKVYDEIRGTGNLMDPPISHNDDYFWLRDDKRDNKKVQDVIELENAHYNDNVDKTLSKQLEEEIISRMDKDYQTYPYVIHDTKSHYKYFNKFIDGKNHRIFCRLNILSNVEEVLLDVNLLAESHDQCDVTNISVNNNEQILSYGVDFNGSEKYDIIFIDLVTGNIIESSMEQIPYATYMWLNNYTVGYIKENSYNKPYQALYYNVDTKITVLKFTELCDEMCLDIYKSSDNKYLFINSSDYDKTKLLYISIDNLDGSPTPICDYVDKTLVTADHKDGMFYLTTNVNQSINYKICVEPVSKFTGEYSDQRLWKDLIPYNEKISINDVLLFQDKILFTTTIYGSDYVNYYDDGKVHVFNMKGFNDTILISNWLTYNWEPITEIYCLTIHSGVFNDMALYISTETMTTPLSTYQVNLILLDNKLTLQYDHKGVWSKQCPNYDPELYDCERIYADNNGVNIPISLMYRKDFKEIGNMPLFLYGYGSYGTMDDALFNYKNMTILDKGFCYAIAHVRGGGFLGQTWYEDGRLKNKMNTFIDFKTSAEHMKQLDYIDSNNVVCEGRSAGGLLAGAMASLYPTIFNTIIMGVPYVDVLNTMVDSTIPLTIEEWTQWGNPNILEDYEYMKKYCPYTNLTFASFPNIYITAGYHDPRVQYWEGLKFLAKLREYDTGHKKHVMEIQMGQGHFGNAGRYKAIIERSTLLAFIITNLNK